VRAGNDANAGSSPEAPWRFAPGMTGWRGQAALQPGDTVLFNSARVWPVEGTQGLHLVGGVSYVGNAWGPGTRATLKATADIASALVRFRDHPSLPTELRGFDVDADGKVGNGIEMNHSFYAGPLTGAVKRIDDVVVHHVWSRASRGQYKYGIIVSNHGGKDAEVANVEILNSTIHDISRDGLPIYPGDASADCIVRNVLVRNNVVYNTGLDPDYRAGAGIVVKGRVIDAVIEHNRVSATKGAGIFVNGNESRHFGFGPSNIHLRHNIVDVDTTHGSIRLYDGAQGQDPKDVHVYGNLVFNNASGPGLLLGADLGNDNTLRIYHNTFFNAPVLVAPSAARFPVFEFRNNIVYATAGVPLTESGRFSLHSNNLFFAAGGATLVRSAGRSYGSANLAAYEPSAIAADPMFIDPRVGKLALRAGSPALDRAAALPEPYNRALNALSRPQGAGADIGAYELPAP
jgi:Right handed beta helix region